MGQEYAMTHEKMLCSKLKEAEELKVFLTNGGILTGKVEHECGQFFCIEKNGRCACINRHNVISMTLH